jgi:hypothetical protein
MKLSCGRCKAICDINCEESTSWKCTYCGNSNKISVEHLDPEMQSGWLSENGICHFPDQVMRVVNGFYLANGSSALSLIQGLVWDNPQKGIETINWRFDQPIPKELSGQEILGVKINTEKIKYLQQEFGDKCILISASDQDVMTNGITPDDWVKAYKFNGLGTFIRQRLLSQYPALNPALKGRR